MGIQGNNLCIFLWYLKSEFLKKNFFGISNPKKSVCLKKLTPRSQAKNKTLFPQYPFLTTLLYIYIDNHSLLYIHINTYNNYYKKYG